MFARFLPLFAAVLLAACATLPPAPTVDEALQMSQAGQSPDAIIARMQASRAVYHLSASDIVRLSQAGMPAAVLDHMQQTRLDEVRQEERQRAWMERNPRWGPGWGWYRW